MARESLTPETDVGGDIPVNSEFLGPYARLVPLPLALERAVECMHFTAVPLHRPILDLGCGDGIFASILFAEPVDTGIDPDARELEVARGRGAYRELIECSGAAIPRPEGAYRTIFSNSVLEHIPDVEPVLREMNRLLHPEGYVYVTIPTHRFDHETIGNQVLTSLRARGLARRWRAMFRRFWNLYNIHHPDDWRAMFERAGFVIDHSFEYEPRSMYLVKEALMPVSLPGAVAKRSLNRWVVTPQWLRRILIAPALVVFRRFLPRWARSDEGCLLFVAMRKAG